MKIYLVGGAVRDKLLGLPVTERDYVVVGASEEEMLRLGYQRVGKEFPVFLHPKTREEYALARSEYKTGPGYKGFVFDTSVKVSLEEDLKRRDLTINAMAQTDEGELIDPYHGAADLKAKKLHHVSDAFAEDPVRMLRVGRFLARYAYLGFTVADDTIALMRQMAQAGEVNALVAERVWKELERALGEKNPEKFFAVLDECDALPILFPGLNINGAGIKALQSATKLTSSAEIRFAALCFALESTPVQKLQDICNRYRVPKEYQQLAKLVAEYHLTAFKAKSLTDEEILNLLSHLDIFRRSERFENFLLACTAVANILPEITFDADWLRTCAQAVKAYPVQELVQQGLDGNAIAAELKRKRLGCLAKWRNQQS